MRGDGGRKKSFQCVQNDDLAKKNGARAKIFLKNGTYRGDWVNDLKHGKGIFEWKNGAIYSGDWGWDRRHGYGVMTELCPTTCQIIQYNGQWCCDEREGRGIQFYPDKESYEGEWHKNKRHGWGRMFYKNGDLYEGEWKMGIREGKGLLRKADSNMFEGTWHQDVKHGPGLYQHKLTGQMQEGIWVNDTVMCSAMEDKNRLFAYDATPYPIPTLELSEPVSVLREAASELLPLIPEQYLTLSDTESDSRTVSAASLHSSTVE